MRGVGHNQFECDQETGRHAHADRPTPIMNHEMNVLEIKLLHQRTEILNVITEKIIPILWLI